MYEIFLKLLDQYGVTPYRVAKETGIASSTFSDWKNGRSNPKPEKLQKIADFFGVSLNYLMTGKEDTTIPESKLTPKDEKDIATDLENIKRKLENKQDGPASFDGKEIPDADLDMFAGQIEIMLRRLKSINKEKYNPNKNKK